MECHSNKYLEYLYLESYFVQQIFVTCLPFRPLVAVVVPDHEVLCWWAKENNLQHDFRPETLCRDPRVREAVLKDLEAVADQHKSVRALLARVVDNRNRCANHLKVALVSCCVSCRVVP